MIINKGCQLETQFWPWHYNFKAVASDAGEFRWKSKGLPGGQAPVESASGDQLAARQKNGQSTQ
jgi:hypothetical protein